MFAAALFRLLHFILLSWRLCFHPLVGPLVGLLVIGLVGVQDYTNLSGRFRGCGMG